MLVKKIMINGQSVECKMINLIVGPNNSGKTTLLKELDTTLRNLTVGDNLKWIQSLTLETVDLSSTYALFLDSIAPSIPDEAYIKLNIMRFYKGLCGVQFSDRLHDYLQNVGNNTSVFWLIHMIRSMIALYEML